MDAYSDELSELGYDQESHVLYSKSECRPWLSLFCRIAMNYEQLTYFVNKSILCLLKERRKEARRLHLTTEE